MHNMPLTITERATQGDNYARKALEAFRIMHRCQAKDCCAAHLCAECVRDCNKLAWLTEGTSEYTQMLATITKKKQGDDAKPNTIKCRAWACMQMQQRYGLDRGPGGASLLYQPEHGPKLLNNKLGKLWLAQETEAPPPKGDTSYHWKLKKLMFERMADILALFSYDDAEAAAIRLFPHFGQMQKLIAFMFNYMLTTRLEYGKCVFLTPEQWRHAETHGATQKTIRDYNVIVITPDRVKYFIISDKRANRADPKHERFLPKEYNLTEKAGVLAKVLRAWYPIVCEVQKELPKILDKKTPSLFMNTIGKKQFTPLTLKLISPTLSRWLTEIQVANSSEEERVRATGTKNKGLSCNSFRHGRAEDLWGVYSRVEKAKKRELENFAREHRTSASVVENVYTDQEAPKKKKLRSRVVVEEF